MSEACRSCGAPLRWAISEKGRRMPLDAEPVPGGNVRITVEPTPFGQVERAMVLVDPHPDRPGYVTHFSTCPQAALHRRRRR